MKRVIVLLIILTVIGAPALTAHSADSSSQGAVSAQGVSCPAIVQSAWDNVDTLCLATGRNEACYGHALLNAEPQPGIGRLEFEEEGHIVNVVDLQSLRLSTMDLASGYWGVALMRIQANLPAAIDKNVSLLLFGDVEIANPYAPVPMLEVQNKSFNTWINARYRPTTQAPIVGTIGPDTIVWANGRLPDSSWLRVELPENGGIGWINSGWVYAPLLEPVNTGDDLAILAEVDPFSTYYGPMQAFYFTSGTTDAPCEEAPNSGLLIQTPEGVAEITLLINEVDIQLGSTVFFQAQPGGEMTVSVVEGHATVTAAGVTHTAVAGTQISIPLSADGKPAGPPSQPRGYDMKQVRGLPVDHMEREVVVAAPLSEEEVLTVIAAQEAAIASGGTVASGGSGNGGDVGDDGDGDSSAEDDSDLPPGLVDNPALGDDLPPGHGGEPPGQSKDDKDNPGQGKDKGKP